MGRPVNRPLAYHIHYVNRFFGPRCLRAQQAVAAMLTWSPAADALGGALDGRLDGRCQCIGYRLFAGNISVFPFECVLSSKYRTINVNVARCFHLSVCFHPNIVQ